MKLYPNMNQSNTTLMIIDVINSCANEKFETPKWGIHFSKIRAMIPSLVTFIKKIREKVNSPIIFVTTAPWTKENLTENINELYTDPRARYYSDDNTGFAEEFYQIGPNINDLVITKNHYDAFTNKQLNEYLEKKEIKYIIAAGIFGDGCVLATICGGFSKGYNFVILDDLIETTDLPERQQIQTGLKQYTWPAMYGKTLKSDEFLQLFANN